jgi:hypothetical protein
MKVRASVKSPECKLCEERRLYNKQKRLDLNKTRIIMARIAG